MLPTLHHIGIVFPDLRDALELMAKLGLEEDYRGVVDQWSVLCLFTKPNGSAPLEFIIPNGGPLAKFNKGAGGLHHIAITVPDLDASRAELEAGGAKFLEQKHVKGAGPFLCNFLDPRYTRGVTVEYIQLLAEK